MRILGRLGLSARTHLLLEKHLTGETMDYRRIMALFFPVLIDQTFIVGLNLLNTAMISSSGVDAISAVSMVDTLNILFIQIFIAMATGGTVVVAQYKGSGNPSMVSTAAAGTIAAVSLLSLAIGLFVALLHGPLLGLLFGSATPEVLGSASTYLIGSGLSYMGLGIVQAVNAAMRGVGRTRVSMALSLIMNGLYVLLNLLLVIGLDMGVPGMTIAVNVARYAAAICALVVVLRMDTELRLRLRELVRVPWSMFKKMMAVGIPFAAEQVFFNGGKMMTQVFIVGMGTYAIAANAISGSLAMLYQVPSMALSLTLVTVVGQCVGARHFDDARKFIRGFLWLSALFFTVMALVLLPLFYPMVRLFNPPDAIIGDVFWIVLINALAQIPLWGISFVLPAGLRAAGDARYTSVIAMLSMWLFRIGLGYVLGVVLGIGIIGVWIAMNGEWGVRGLLFWRRYRSGKWQARSLV
ncbi:MATE family efflux transporter [Paenibacillus sp. IB182496]|uniref:Probable multidrug resistance protein NorM n=1 Tax=Paenibacillus sabuli TaxID=2772509 RepID=A0A927BQ58_9BACL|nr:MATE family efflux transporter [Paenibacillus sabuli]MBD2844222.1 MATE family efflux transporter [Paenibacillus sabuli]